MRRLVLAISLGLVGACAQMDNPGSGPAPGDDAGNGATDDLGSAPPACTAPQVARYGVCIDPPASCATDDDCENDSYCFNGECIPYGVGPRGKNDPGCLRTPVIGLFAPKAKCAWTAPPAGDPYPDHKNVLSTPLVVDFNFDNDPATIHPSIVFVTYNCQDGACGAQPGCYGVVRVVDGDTCQQQYSVAGSALMIGSVTPAVGDINGDGRPDIVAEHQGGGVMGFSWDAAQNKFVELWSSYSSFDGAGCHWESVSIHDLDDDGKPELIMNGPNPAVFDNQGNLLDGAAATTSYSEMLHPVLADLDGDGAVELIDGKEAFRFDKATRKWTVAANFGGPSLGQVAFADFGTFGANPAQDDRTKLDGEPEIAVVTSGQVRVQTLAGRVVFGPVNLPGSPAGTGGAPTIGDFDGDGRVEIGVAGATDYAVFDPDCVAGAAAAVCPTGAANGILWAKAAQDLSSNVTGSSVFDFDGDGKDEVVYADECFSRVYEGPTGEVLFSQYHTSCTWYENPVVADVDGKFRSELVIPSNSNCGVTCPALDPIHDGVRCDSSADCPGTTTCGRELPTDKYGRCRCAQTSECGDPGLACADPIAGPSAVGKVCRAQHPQGAAQQGILVLHDALDRWVASRPLWNQHAYSVTNVNDDGTIPKTSKWAANWKTTKLNNFRLNVQGALSPLAEPDLTSAPNAMPGQHTNLICTAGSLRLEARVCNRGTSPVGAGEPVAFYQGIPPSGPALCTTSTAKTMQPGDCDVVSCDWKNAPTTATDVSVVADDDGTGKGVSTECKDHNNRGTLYGVYCETLL